MAVLRQLPDLPIDAIVTTTITYAYSRLHASKAYDQEKQIVSDFHSARELMDRNKPEIEALLKKDPVFESALEKVKTYEYCHLPPLVFAAIDNDYISWGNIIRQFVTHQQHIKICQC